MASIVSTVGEKHRGRAGLSLVGAVVGATWPAQAAALRQALPFTPFLVPGYGAQGATAADVAAAYLPRGAAGALGALGAVVNASRSVTFPATKDPSASWRAAVEAAARAAKEELHAARDRAR
jgi:orotidine-5'-phosphate decarboxylase